MNRCQTKIIYNDDDSVSVQLVGHSFNASEVCEWCGIEALGLYKYTEKNSVISVDMRTGKVDINY